MTKYRSTKINYKNKNVLVFVVFPGSGTVIIISTIMAGTQILLVNFDFTSVYSAGVETAFSILICCRQGNQNPERCKNCDKIHIQISSLLFRALPTTPFSSTVYCNSFSIIHPFNKYLWNAYDARHHARMTVKIDPIFLLVEHK